MQISNHFSVSSATLSSESKSRAVAPSQPGEVSSNPGLNPIDQLDFSPEANAILSNEEANADIRTEKVASIRQQIAAGTYDTDEKLEAALMKLMESLG